jgi:hypothetical protein
MHSNEKNLRDALIRLAAQKPELRNKLLPILKKAISIVPKNIEILNDASNMVMLRTNSSITITDLRNAGKRGKNCDTLVLYNLDYGEYDQLALERALEEVIKMPNFDMAAYELQKFNNIQTNQHARYYGKFQLTSQKGVAVAPATFGPIVIDTPNFSLKSDFTDFVIRDKEDKYNLPVCIPALKGGKNSIKQFYRWVTDNRAVIEKLKFEDLTRAMSDAGIKYHQYCSMD